MNGLRVYIKPESHETCSTDVTFYSRRASGPYYRWHYEKIRARWFGSRMQAPDFAASELVIAPWKEVPDALKSQLSEHYVE